MDRGTFYTKLAFEPNTGCWIWLGIHKSNGYGGVKAASSNGFNTAHRFSYYLHHGDFDRTKLVIHSCDTPLCVNPDHLRLGTVQDNYDDMKLRGRRPKGWKLTKLRRKVYIKIDAVQAEVIRACYSERHYPYYKMAAYFGVSTMTVHHIVNGRKK